MTTHFSVRPWRMTALACLSAAFGLTLATVPAKADDAGAHDFLIQEVQRVASKAPKAATTAKPSLGAATTAQDKAAPAQTRSVAGTKTRRTSKNPLAAAPDSLRAIVRREAAANGVPVTLAKAVVTVESRWNPRITGRAGEVGLMQIKYPTARMIGYTGTRAGLYDPATNIKWGMKYLAGAHRLAGGDVCGTVSRYQGGHGVRGVTRMGAVYCAKAKGHIAAMSVEASPRIALNDRVEPRG